MLIGQPKSWAPTHPWNWEIWFSLPESHSDIRLVVSRKSSLWEIKMTNVHLYVHHRCAHIIWPRSQSPKSRNSV